MEKHKLTFLKNSFYMLVSVGINKGLLFIMIPLYTRWLTLDEYGLYDVWMSYIALCIPLFTLSSGNGVFRLSLEDDSEIKSYVFNGLAIVIFSLVFWIPVLCLYSFFFNRKFFYLIILIVTQCFDEHFQGFLRAIKKLNLLALTRTFSVVIVTLSSIIFTKLLSGGAIGLILSYSLGYCITDIFFVIYTKYYKYVDQGLISLEKIKELVKYSIPLIPNDISWWIINVSDRSLIRLYIGTAANAIYGISYKIPNLVTAILGAFNVSWQETVSEEMDVEKKRIIIQEVHDKYVGIILSIAIFIIAISFAFFDYIFDSRYSDARLYVAILIIATIFNLLALFYGGIQIGLKNTKVNGTSTIIGAIVNISVHLLLINYIGLYAAAFSTLASNFTVFFIRRRQLSYFSFRLSKTVCFNIIILLVVSIFSMYKHRLFMNILIAILSFVILLFQNGKNITKFFLIVFSSRNVNL